MGGGYWDLPIPIVNTIKVDAKDIVFYDGEGYEIIREYLKDQKIENILLGGYATDICVKESVAGYIDLVDDFNVFIVGDATMATFPARSRPSEPTRDELIRASLYVPITQISWIKKMNN